MDFEFDLVIKNGTLILKDGETIADIGVSGKKIKSISKNLQGHAKEVFDATGMHIFPGIIDTQVHFREPGLVHKEDLESGSRAAALGGVCTFLEMPNTKPPTTTIESIKEKVNLAKEKSHVNFGFFIGATGENLDELKKAHDLEGCCGVKIFLGSSTGSLLLYDEEKLLEIFKSLQGMIAVHSESEVMLNERLPIRDNAKDVHAHYEWRNAETALSSTKMIVDIAKKAKRKVHVLHITTKEEMQFLKENKEHVTVEVTPQHLTLNAPDIYDRIGTLAQMNPPIRTQDHQDGLWKGLLDGTVDVIGSDHAPHTLEEKSNPYPASPSGMPGVQTIFPLMLHHHLNGKLDRRRLVDLLCERPAELYQLNKGRIEIGRDADFTIVDLSKTTEIKNTEQASKCGWTPFDGMELKGKVEATIVMGSPVMINGKILPSKSSTPIKKEGSC
ncbi:dihydroorotase [Halobacteriovorax sp. GB3]|uniref:dihydroorotase n=1 Tax=Halobacteriovorax sp. GB3 TaxID=2719615 RepID=UPI00235F9595|nr:dihydroorotase [Halobacteriovorax sp. GB3]MDD0853779.1 dihydroorotase [Halobacteriovorax sp. GB3]